MATEIKTYVLVIYTGGTIGMKESPDGYVPVAGYLEELLMSYPNFNDPDYTITSEDTEAMKGVVDEDKTYDLQPIPLYKTQDDNNYYYRIIYGILEYNPLLDSSNMNMQDWEHIGATICNNYQKFAGFVILHGTDTMAYTSSALSFMLENLNKPVVVTGSQVSMVHLRTDAIENLVGSLIIAGKYSIIKEVGLFFNNTLYRGNRVTKINASEFFAFDSPNFPPLVQIGVNINVNQDLLYSSGGSGVMTLHSEMESKVGVFMLFPGITAITMAACLTQVKGAVILTFGSGNGPDNNQALMDVFKTASDHGILLLNITQCLKGTVEGAYATGTALEKAGLIPGGDMTPEAALTKLSYILTTGMSPDAMKQALRDNLRGEVSST